MRIEQLGPMALAIAVGAAALPSRADVVQLRVSVQNLAPQNSVAFAPLRVGFNSGVFDSFDEGQVATAPIISIAEGGSGSDWFPAFAAADPTATLGTVVPNPAGPLLPGGTASAEFTVDTDANPYFTFGAMVVPSNDYFIGNDSPTQHRLFDTMGQLSVSSISQFGRDVWDAGSETEDPAGAAFLVVGNNGLRTPENDVVRFDFMDLDTFNGLETGAGYIFQRQFGAADEIYRISFAIVPAPASTAVIALAGLLAGRRRR